MSVKRSNTEMESSAGLHARFVDPASDARCGVVMLAQSDSVVASSHATCPSIASIPEGDLFTQVTGATSVSLLRFGHLLRIIGLNSI